MSSLLLESDHLFNEQEKVELRSTYSRENTWIETDQDGDLKLLWNEV